MGNAMQKAMDTKSEIDGKKAVVDENKGEFMKLTGVIAENVGAPVLGPLGCLAFHRLVGLFAFVFFLSTLSAAVPTFYEKKSFATVEFQPVRFAQPARVPLCHQHLHRSSIVA